MDDAGFESLRQETVRGFPDQPALPESARLKSEVENMKLAELKMMIERVEFRARASETEASATSSAPGPAFR
ncbi:hypothetical protein EMGBD4_10900 [Verrucomicrobiota bacterium]|nr:hypothetical protein EMGBD4_10900 [Verrucomicrobiota bacterium]